MNDDTRLDCIDAALAECEAENKRLKAEIEIGIRMYKRLQAENKRLKADLERALRDVDMFEKLANESKS